MYLVLNVVVASEVKKDYDGHAHNEPTVSGARALKPWNAIVMKNTKATDYICLFRSYF